MVVNRNDLFRGGRCKRCVPAMAAVVEALRGVFGAARPVVEVFGSEPYLDQVRCSTSTSTSTSTSNAS